MFGTKPRVNPLVLRKELLIAESEINRVQALEEWQTMTDLIRSLAVRVKSAGALASAAALLLSALSGSGRGKSESTGAKRSWLQKMSKGAQVATSLWLALRARPRQSAD